MCVGGFPGDHDPSQWFRLPFTQGTRLPHQTGQGSHASNQPTCAGGLPLPECNRRPYPRPDALRNVGLGGHGIDGDDASFRRQRGQEFRNRRRLVAPLRWWPLPQPQSITASTGADQVQRGVASMLSERRRVLPSLATAASAPSAGRTVSTHCRNAGFEFVQVDRAEEASEAVKGEYGYPDFVIDNLQCSALCHALGICGETGGLSSADSVEKPLDLPLECHI